jgi:DNA-binding MarR family transcriptional regulator
MTKTVAQSPGQHPGLLLHDCYRLLRRCLRDRFGELGLSEPQWRVLTTVNRIPGISQTRLAGLLGIGKAPLGSLVDRLEDDDLLYRSADPADRRANQLYLSQRSGPIVQALRERYLAAEREFMAGISEAERRRARQTLASLYLFLQELDPRADAATPGELPLMLLLAGVNRLNGRLFDRQLKELGFTRSQWLVLDAVAAQEGLRQTELARRLSMQKAPLGNLVDELTAGGWVERRTHPRDRRARQLYLTQACRDRLQTLYSDYEKVHHRALQCIDAGQRQQLRRTLMTLRQNLGAMASSAIPETQP